MIDEEHVREELDLRPTEELVQILAERDEDEWRPEVFSIVEQLLRERGVAAPGPDEGPPSPQTRALSGELVERSGPQPVVIAQLDDRMEVQLCHRTLGHAGIEVRVRDVTPEGGAEAYELLVDESQAEAARGVLAAAEAAAEDADQSEGFRCPSCGFMAEPLNEGSRLICQVCGEAS